jgi:hypothetical protein
VAQADLAALDGVVLPVDSLREALPHLRRPFTPEAIKFKVQNVFPKKGDPKGCIVVAYIDVRLVIERLNAVVGEAWEPKPVRLEGEAKFLWCHLTVCGGTRPDLGESYKGMSKDLWSDAIKRAGVQFGIGVSVYALPQITLFSNQPHVEVREVWDKQANGMKKTLVLTELGHTKLREGYAKWLEDHGRRLFGPELDHGDVEGDTIDPEAESDDEFVPAAPAALEDEEAVQLIGQARELYAKIQDAEGAAAFPPAKFQAWLEQSWHSHDGLRELVAHLEQRAAGREA